MELRDNEDEAIRLLRLIARNTGSTNAEINQTTNETNNIDRSRTGDVTNNQTVNVDASDSSRSPANWFTTGPNPISINPGDGWEEFEFGFVARAVHIRFTAAIEFSPTNPHNSGPAAALPDPNGTWGSYELGGQPPIRTDTIWIRFDPDSTDNAANISMEAY